jgi:uncharacterized membrane protein HdeD (DUF308 family)
MNSMNTEQLTPAPMPSVAALAPDRSLTKWFLSIWGVGTALALAVFAKFARDAPNTNRVPTIEALGVVLGYTGVTSIFLAIGAVLVASMITKILCTKHGAKPDGAQWFGVTALLGLFTGGWFVVTFLATWIMHDVFDPALNDC